MDFTGKSVLITGASRGIGYGIAKAFASAGADLTIVADDPKTTDAAAELGKLAGRPVRGMIADIADRAAVTSTVGTLEKIDVLINNAGLELITPIDEKGGEVEDTFRRIVDINVNGSFFVTREALRKIPDGGRIIFTASVWGKSAEAGFSAYCASKHAVIGLMRTLAKELGPRNITVNAVCPGWVKTVASMRSLGRMAVREKRDEQALLDDIVATQAIGGLMQPDDIAGPYLFLASTAAANITGQALNIDRGELMS
ncbi:MAG: SDR family NAD(P)-dependent oxidoreductase [Geminicoccaceae bacterium]